MPQQKPLYGYPSPAGSKEQSVFEHTGPAVYAALVIGPPVTVGDVISAREAGLRTFDVVDGGPYSNDGLFIVTILHANGDGAPLDHVHARWVSVATGVEVVPGVNLSAHKIRLWALGNH
jgi:hypothetical protein